ncbi:MAG: hypothetical protein RLZZ519_1932 [Bacteroidota bacterium]
MQFTRDQIIQLAPDDASVKAGQQLATTSKWVSKSVHPQALWGDCQGSGSTPYKTMVDLENMAFKCSCPSRKFPCKHGLGLMLLFLANPTAFTQQDNLSPSVEEWLSKRTARAEAKETKEAKPIDEKAQQKRQEAREKKVESGVEELRLWLKDLVRTGIIGVPQNAYQFAQNITSRMVDAQAGGLAAQLRKLQKINYFKEGWQKELLSQISKLYLLTDAFQKSETLPPDWQLELKLLVGWTVPKEEVLANQGIRDEWAVLSKTQEEDGNLQTERIWLYGTQSGRFALILNFYAAGQLPQHLLVPGSMLPAELVFFPSVYPLRALVKTQEPIRRQLQTLQVAGTVADAHASVAASLGCNPFLDKIPLILSEVQLSRQGATWFSVDPNGDGIQIKNTGLELWTILALTQGNPFSCFGVFEEELLDIQAVWFANEFHPIQ